MSCIATIEEKKRGGMVYGPSHKGGGVKYTIQDTGTVIEEEGKEINIPHEISNDDKIYTFSGTNYEILNKILGMGNLIITDKVTTVKSGDIVICIRSAWDDKERSYTGTIQQILSAINESRGCLAFDAGAKVTELANGGTVPDIKILKTTVKGAMRITNGDKTAWIMPKMRRADGTFTEGAYKALAESDTTLAQFEEEQKQIELDFCEIIKETDKAIQVKIRLKYPDKETKDIDTWFPKSKASVKNKKLFVDSYFWEKIKRIEILEKEKFYLFKTFNDYENSYGVDVVTEELITEQERRSKIFIPKSISKIIDGTLIVPAWIISKRLEEKESGYKTGAYQFSSSIHTHLTEKNIIVPEIVPCKDESPAEQTLISDLDSGWLIKLLGEAEEDDIDKISNELKKRHETRKASSGRAIDDKEYAVINEWISKLVLKTGGKLKEVPIVITKILYGKPLRHFTDYEKEDFDILFAKLKIPITLKEKLGEGSYGYAYSTTKNTVAKITKDTSEPFVSAILKVHKLKSQANIFNVFKITDGEEYFYVIEKEELEPIYSDFDILQKYRDDIKYVSKNKLDKLINTIINERKQDYDIDEPHEEDVREYIYKLKEFFDTNKKDIDKFPEAFTDLHGGNIGYRNSKIVCFDCAEVESGQSLKYGGLANGYRANRPSPSQSATLYDNGYILEGNDGKLWKIGVTEAGIHRWVKLRPDEQGLYSEGDYYGEVKLKKFPRTPKYSIGEKVKAMMGKMTYVDGKITDIIYDDRFNSFLYQIDGKGKYGQDIIKSDKDEYLVMLLEWFNNPDEIYNKWFDIIEAYKDSGKTARESFAVILAGEKKLQTGGLTEDLKNYYTQIFNVEFTEPQKIYDEWQDTIAIYHESGLPPTELIKVIKKAQLKEIERTRPPKLDWEIEAEKGLIDEIDWEYYKTKYTQLKFLPLLRLKPTESYIWFCWNEIGGVKNYVGEKPVKKFKKITHQFKATEKIMSEFGANHCASVRPYDIKFDDELKLYFEFHQISSVYDSIKADIEAINEKRLRIPEPFKIGNEYLIWNIVERDYKTGKPTDPIVYYKTKFKLERISDVGKYNKGIGITFFSQETSTIEVIPKSEIRQWARDKWILNADGSPIIMANGGTIDADITERWAKKKEHIHQLANNIHRLRLNITKDLKSEDEKTFLTALVIALMMKTGERVGNEVSAENGHYGITGLRKKHVEIDCETVTLKYIGKSGVYHYKKFKDEKIAEALLKAIKNSPKRYVFTTSDGLKIKRNQVNKYLTEFNITAKDIRGYSANHWIIKKLLKKEIPDTDKKRKRLFNTILRKVAIKLGHGAGTLKKHYLIPELAENYINKGKIIDIKKLGYINGGKTN